jgi:hypothetical protein
MPGRDRAQDHHRPAIQASPHDQPQPIPVRFDCQVEQVIRTEHDQSDFRVETFQPGPDVFLSPSEGLAALVAELRALPVPPAFRAQVSVDPPEGVLHLGWGVRAGALQRSPEGEGLGGRHKRAIGLEPQFNTALDASRAQDSGNYTLTETVKHGRRSSAHAVAIQAIYDSATDSVGLMFVGKAPFTKGRQLVVNAKPPGGIDSTSGTALDGNNEGVPRDNGVFVILPRARGVTR